MVDVGQLLFEGQLRQNRANVAQRNLRNLSAVIDQRLEEKQVRLIFAVGKQMIESQRVGMVLNVRRFEFLQRTQTLEPIIGRRVQLGVFDLQILAIRVRQQKLRKRKVEVSAGVVQRAELIQI